MLESKSGLFAAPVPSEPTRIERIKENMALTPQKIRLALSEFWSSYRSDNPEFSSNHVQRTFEVLAEMHKTRKQETKNGWTNAPLGGFSAEFPKTHRI